LGREKHSAPPLGFAIPFSEKSACRAESREAHIVEGAGEDEGSGHGERFSAVNEDAREGCLKGKCGVRAYRKQSMFLTPTTPVQK